MAVILGLAAVAAYGLALWKVPHWMHLTKPQNRHNARLLVISVGGALVVLIGLLYTARNYRLSRRGQVTDRFTIALERLGSSELYVRIGGVHALEHVMRDSPAHHNDVIEVLTQFIRGRAPDLEFIRRRGRHLGPPKLPRVPAPDVQAALTALADRPHRPERQEIDLTDLHLANAWLSGANLTCARLGGADLTGAQLGDADLTRATLGGANLTGAQLGGANLTRVTLGGANLTDARFDRADLTGAWLNLADLTDARFGDANLTGARLDHATNLTRARFGGANLTGARLGANPSVVLLGWVITDSRTGELRRATP